MTKRESRRSAIRAASNPWLWAALAATVIAVALGATLMGELAVSLAPGAQTEASGQDASGVEPLVVVVARTPGGAGEWSNFARVVAYLAEEVGQPMSVRYVPREDQASDVIMAEEADVAFLCAHMYMDLADAGVVEGLAVPVVDGESECTMQLVVAAGSPEAGLKDLAGDRIAVSSKSSLGGEAFLLWLCAEADVPLPGYFGEVQAGETMEENVASLLDGDVDAAVVNSVQLSPSFRDRLKIVEESPSFGIPPMVVSTSMDPGTKARLRAAVLAFDAASVIPGESRLDGFVPIEQVDYSFEEELRLQCGDHGHP